MNIHDQLHLTGIIPVIKIENQNHALPMAEALLNAGMTCLEITFRTEAAPKVIRTLVQAYPQLLIGAGTILSKAQVDQAIEAGAQFIVTPGFNPETVAHCLQRKIPIIPGCSSPTDIESALAFGITTVKFFPAEQLGGLPIIKALSAPYSQVRFIATGGITAENFRSYLDSSNVSAIAGSWMVTPEMLNNERFDVIEKTAKQAVQTLLGIRIEALELQSLPQLLVEVVKWEKLVPMFRVKDAEEAANGTIVLSCLDIIRTKHYLAQQDLLPLPSKTTSTDLKSETNYAPFGKFKIKLIQR